MNSFLITRSRRVSDLKKNIYLLRQQSLYYHEFNDLGIVLRKDGNNFKN